jgi:hypothetical protein
MTLKDIYAGQEPEGRNPYFIYNAAQGFRIEGNQSGYATANEALIDLRLQNGHLKCWVVRERKS